MRNTARALGASAALIAALALAGCGDDSTVAEDPTAVSTTPTPEPVPATSVPSEPLPDESDVPAPGDTLITLDTPAENATVSGSFEASGTANSPEANVPWQVLAPGGDVVLEGFFTAEGWMDKLYPYAGSVDVSTLAPGPYVFRVSTDDPSGGEGNAPQSVERHITVQ
ncbi:MAG TPA: Gmad2 immunoglobulin-like domain-containing protein [Nocardioides sp.]|uniref:Gmad2 immunoglobulin-like domain-containing protein n=1 Tax=Nocardioides sp. TaxID=35761 RepID=UPI002ED95E05